MSAPVEIPEEFTPGPWQVGPTSDEPGLPEIAIVTPDGACPAVAIPLGKATAANARLIALAPQMAAEITALRADCQSLALGEAEAMALVLSHEGHIEAQAAELLALRADVTRLTASLAAAEGERHRFLMGLSDVVSRCRYLSGDELGDIAEAAMTGKTVEEIEARRAGDLS